ncbi:MAG: hypothetical protein AB8C84_10520 [Oligoflexales bacterium]
MLQKLTILFFTFSSNHMYASKGSEQINDNHIDTPYDTQSTTLHSSQAEVTYEVSSSATAMSATQDPHSSCFETGFFPFPIFGIDYDKNRIVTYMGIDICPIDEFSQERGHYTGPFEVSDMSYLHGNLALIFSPFTACGGVFGGPGIGGYGYNQLNVIRTVKNLNELEHLKKIRTFPKTVEKIWNTSDGTMITSKGSAAITFLGKAIGGYVFAIGPEFVFSGNWIARVIKKNDHEVSIVLKKIKETCWSFSAALVTSYLTSKISNINEKVIAFDLPLDTLTGQEVYNKIFKSHFSSKHIKALESLRESVDDIFESDLKSKATATVIKLGLPVFMSWNKNFGSLEISQEKIEFLSTQDLTILGSVPKGTIIESFFIKGSSGTHTQGILTKHRSRTKQHEVRHDKIYIPAEENKEEQLDRLPPSRLITSFTYSFKKDNLSKKTWLQQIKKMSSYTGFTDSIFNAMSDVLHSDKTDHAEFETTLKISQAALQALHTAARDDFHGVKQRLIEAANTHWLNLNTGKRKDLKKSFVFIDKALHKISEIHFEDFERTEEILNHTLHSISSFISYISKNPFAFKAFLDEFTKIRMHDRTRDFALSVNWKGSNLRSDILILTPSTMRRDRNKCYLQHETGVRSIPQRTDYELFGQTHL